MLVLKRSKSTRLNDFRLLWIFVFQLKENTHDHFLEEASHEDEVDTLNTEPDPVAKDIIEILVSVAHRPRDHDPKYYYRDDKIECLFGRMMTNLLRLHQLVQMMKPLYRKRLF